MEKSKVSEIIEINNPNVKLIANKVNENEYDVQIKGK